MNRPALEALRDTLRQTILPHVNVMTVVHLLDALLAPDAEEKVEPRAWDATPQWRPGPIPGLRGREGPCPCVQQGLTHEGAVITESCQTMPARHTTWMCKRTIADAPAGSGIATSLPFDRAEQAAWQSAPGCRCTWGQVDPACPLAPSDPLDNWSA